MNIPIQRIAVFSDNPKLLEKISEMIPKDVIVDYFCSIYSKPTDFVDLSVNVLDIKKDYLQLIDIYKLVLSIHCKQIFPEELVKRIKCINLHPGYNPINRGWYPQVFSIIHGLETGATLHEMDEKLDHGNIIDRRKVEIDSFDTSLRLYNKIVRAELELVKENLSKILVGDYVAIKPENNGNVFLKKDYEKLKEIDLNKKGTYKEVINHLRAMTHGNFNNAFYIDSITNKKIFIKIDLIPE